MFYRNRICFLLNIVIPALLIVHARGGAIADAMANNPDHVREIIEAGTIQELLQFVEEAYLESKQVDGIVAKYAYMLALDQAPLNKRVQLSLDFSLTKTELHIKQFGARGILIAVTQGATIAAAHRDQSIAKLKTELSALGTPSREAFDFAKGAASALIALGEDAGLDVLLTDTETVRNYRNKDGWEATSGAAVFTQLKANYEQKAANPQNQNPEPDRLMAAVYELCRVRRTQSKEIKPIQPLSNLSQLLPK